jgi:periplasmic divalent cation tolerance protein
MSAIIATCAFPDTPAAVAAAYAAVEAGLAACCQVGGPVTSIYRWEGKTEMAQEIILTCKTTESAWPQLCALLKERHPYEVPEILASPVSHGHEPYLAWVEANAAGSKATGSESS